jgi:hypothetical protein
MWVLLGRLDAMLGPNYDNILEENENGRERM